MAYAKQRGVVSNSRGSGGALAVKIAIALTVCLVVRVLVAQAPGAGITLKEDVDPRNYKILVPNEYYLDKKNQSKLNDQKTYVRNVITSAPQAPSINDPSTKLVLDRYYLQYIFPLMTPVAGCIASPLGLR